MLNSIKNSKLLVVVAHPDDELLGLGATMFSLASFSNCYIKVIILGEGITSRAEQRIPEHWKKELSVHQRNIQEAKAILGYHELSNYQLPDNRFDEVALLDIVKIIETGINDFKPDFIFTHHHSDLNIDHRQTFQAVLTATRPLPDKKTPGILTFETPSSTEWSPALAHTGFLPNIYFKITKEAMSAKISAMECYEFEKRDFPHPRSPEALKILAQKRGMEAGLELAEAFMLIRHIAQIEDHLVNGC